MSVSAVEFPVRVVNLQARVRNSQIIWVECKHSHFLAACWRHQLTSATLERVNRHIITPVKNRYSPPLICPQLHTLPIRPLRSTGVQGVPLEHIPRLVLNSMPTSTNRKCNLLTQGHKPLCTPCTYLSHYIGGTRRVPLGRSWSPSHSPTPGAISQRIHSFRC